MEGLAYPLKSQLIVLDYRKCMWKTQINPRRCKVWDFRKESSRPWWSKCRIWQGFSRLREFSGSLNHQDRRYVQLGWFKDSWFNVALHHQMPLDVISMGSRTQDDIVSIRPFVSWSRFSSTHTRKSFPFCSDTVYLSAPARFISFNGSSFERATSPHLKKMGSCGTYPEDAFGW